MLYELHNVDTKWRRSMTQTVIRVEAREGWNVIIDFIEGRAKKGWLQVSVTSERKVSHDGPLTGKPTRLDLSKRHYIKGYYTSLAQQTGDNVC